MYSCPSYSGSGRAISTPRSCHATNKSTSRSCAVTHTSRRRKITATRAAEPSTNAAQHWHNARIRVAHLNQHFPYLQGIERNREEHNDESLMLCCAQVKATKHVPWKRRFASVCNFDLGKSIVHMNSDFRVVVTPDAIREHYDLFARIHRTLWVTKYTTVSSCAKQNLRKSPRLISSTIVDRTCKLTNLGPPRTHSSNST